MMIRSKLLLGFGSIALIITIVAVYNIFFLNSTSKKTTILIEKRNDMDSLLKQVNSDVMIIYSDVLDSFLLETREAKEAKISQIYTRGGDLQKKIVQTVNFLKGNNLAVKINDNYNKYNEYVTTILTFKDNSEMAKNITTANRFKESKSDFLNTLSEISFYLDDQFNITLADLKKNNTTNNIVLIVIIIAVILASIIITFFISKGEEKPDNKPH